MLRRLFCGYRRKSIVYFSDSILFFPTPMPYNGSKEEEEAYDTQREDFGIKAPGEAGAQA